MIHLGNVDKLRLKVAEKSARSYKSAMGQFFTPQTTAGFMAGLFSSDGGKCRLIDAGAGIGSLSSAFLGRVAAGTLKFEGVQVAAYEMDIGLHEPLKQVLGRFSGVDFQVIGGDFFEHAVNDLQFKSGGGFTHAIMNPPYKKINTGSKHRNLLSNVGLETVNAYSAFVGLVVALMAKGGEVVAIIPRSWCNGPYYRPFRQFVFARAALTHIHVFEARNKAFKDDSVLQETIIVRLVKSAAQGDVVVSTSSDDGFGDLETYIHPFARIIQPGDSESFVHIPTTQAVSTLAGAALAFGESLKTLGISASTGPVVDFRLRDHLRVMPEAGCCPLIYANHYTTGELVWPIEGGKKPNAIVVNSETRKWLIPNGCYTITRRFSSKEEKRRVVASVIDLGDFPGSAVLGLENHLNYFHRAKQPLSRELAHGLAAYLNSTAVDEHLRRFSGHTQVNATDLKSLPYPSEMVLSNLGKWAIGQGGISQEEVDGKIVELIG